MNTSLKRSTKNEYSHKQISKNVCCYFKIKHTELQTDAHRVTVIQLDLDPDFKHKLLNFSYFRVYFVTEEINIFIV